MLYLWLRYLLVTSHISGICFISGWDIYWLPAIYSDICFISGWDNFWLPVKHLIYALALIEITIDCQSNTWHMLQITCWDYLTSYFFAEIMLFANHLTYFSITLYETPLIMSHVRHMLQYQLLDWEHFSHGIL
jgi:hypothetical protein